MLKKLILRVSPLAVVVEFALAVVFELVTVVVVPEPVAEAVVVVLESVVVVVVVELVVVVVVEPVVEAVVVVAGTAINVVVVDRIVVFMKVNSVPLICSADERF